MTPPLPPGATIGILGTGQLGRMLAGAAAKLGFRVATFGPESDPPAARVADCHHIADYNDHEALQRFAKTVDAATFEFENIAASTVKAVADAGTSVRPGPRVLAVCQDRVAEKDYLRSLGVATAPYKAIDGMKSLRAAVCDIGVPAILKSRRFGYDGKGQYRIESETDLEAALNAVGSEGILEGFVRFEGEFSQIAGRGTDGSIVFFDCPENRHEGGILRESRIPCAAPDALVAQARTVTQSMLEDLDYTGVIAVEYFWSSDDGLIANEIAPRVHNSGHWTVEACRTSQFEVHIRAVAGWPLGDPSRHSDAVMTNLIGDETLEWQKLVGNPDLSVTLYGKRDCRPGRKMGHTTQLLRPAMLQPS